MVENIDERVLSKIEDERAAVIDEVAERVTDNEVINLLKGKCVLITQGESPRNLLLTIKVEFERKDLADEALTTLSNYIGQRCGVIL
jgi:hypothetical protein